MPKRSRRSQQAKAQRVSGRPGFDSGLLDEDPFDLLRDPDFDPNNIDDVDDRIDSDAESLCGRCDFAFSMVGDDIATDPEDSVDEEASSSDEDYEDQASVSLAASVVKNHDDSSVREFEVNNVTFFIPM